jgi:hypothetical protein
MIPFSITLDTLIKKEAFSKASYILKLIFPTTRPKI